ncbi:UNVERIFIED_CONTAM: hypothetical protein GTU68_019629, partial [Idotea baltica]|nr:hypothetical protein [Idotea baltica]
IFQIAYCKSEDLRRWFIQQECDLFVFRFNLEQSSDQDNATDNWRTIEQFLEKTNCHFESITKSERDDMRDQLRDGSASLSNNNFKSTIDSSTFYKVHFTEGFAFVPDCDIVSLVTARFRGHLSRGLSLVNRSLTHLDEDTRVIPLLTAISKSYIGEDFSRSGESEGVVTAGQVDHLAKTSFPPCMQHLHQALRRDNHLKHHGRLQYGLFLKGIGLSLEESMKFWRAAFQPKVDANKFDKQYAYNVRYNYGKEGKRVNMSPYSCMRIITTNMPGPGDSHGCPFRHTESDLLRQRLQSAKQLSPASLNRIIDLSENHQYQLACREYFKEVHACPDANDIVINHPNEYFVQSQRYLSAERSETNSTRRVIKIKAESSASEVLTS